MKFYKLKNGNRSFEYDVANNLEEIKVLLAEKNNSLICGIFSGIISNFIVNDIDNFIISKNVFFILLLVGIYILLEILLKGFSNAKVWFRKYLDRDKVSDVMEMKARDVFFCKIVEEAVLGVSLVNRVAELKENDEKPELRYIYAWQAKYTFEKVAILLEELLLEKTKKQRRLCIETIGKAELSWLIDTVVLYLEKLEGFYEGIYVKNIIEFYTRCKKEWN